MAWFMIELPHTEEECLKALDEELGKGKDTSYPPGWQTPLLTIKGERHLSYIY